MKTRMGVKSFTVILAISTMISFPILPAFASETTADDNGTLLGDIVLQEETIREEAASGLAEPSSEASEPDSGTPAIGDNANAPRSAVDRRLELKLNLQSTFGTTIEQKDDSSSVYLHVQSMGNFARLYTDAFRREPNGHLTPPRQ